MDLATIIGLLGGSALVVAAVFISGAPAQFVNIPGLLIVLGGTFATCFIKFTMKDVVSSVKVAMKAFMARSEAPEDIILEMAEISKMAKKEGLIALEKRKMNDEFTQKAMSYLADGYDEGLIEDMLEKDILLTVNRHVMGQKIFRGMGISAPAFGMIGTLIGLVQMLANMGEPSTIGPSMATALLTTLYGALIANLICLPIAEKLELRSDQEQTNKRIVMEAAVAMSRGLSPILLEEALKVFLSPKDRKKIEAGSSNRE
jgi:chemotaxis protein MotA